MKRWPIYPFLLGLFPLLTIYQANTGEVGFHELLMPATLVLGGALILLCVTWPLMRSVHRAAIFTAAVVWCFMTFQRWTTAVAWATARFNSQAAIPWEVCGLQALLLILVFLEARKRIKHPENWTKTLNLFAAIMVALPALTSAWRVFQDSRGAAARSAVSNNKIALPSAATLPSREMPDIYLIILDAHARADVLSRLYNYDSGPFLQHLRDKGFYIADSSTSNYCFTELSIGAMLNMRYLDEFNGSTAETFAPLEPLILHSALSQTLHGIGYKWVAFQSFWPTMCMPDSDVYFHLPDLNQTSPFNQMLIDSTAMSLAPVSSSTMDLYHAKRAIIKYEFKYFGDALPVPGPKFVFFHIFSPHPPFVFASDGSDPGYRVYGNGSWDPCLNMPTPDYRENYRNQLIYTDGQALDVIDKILNSSPGNPPVIVMVGDHGARSGMKAFDATDSDVEECMGNLTAVLLPGKSDRGLYSTITPVNLFRVVLNDYFDAKLPMLPDKSFFSDPSRYVYRDVTSRLHPALTER